MIPLPQWGGLETSCDPKHHKALDCDELLDNSLNMSSLKVPQTEAIHGHWDHACPVE